MKISELIRDAVEELQRDASAGLTEASDPESFEGRLAAEVLLAYVLNCGKEDLFTKDRLDVSSENEKKFRTLFRRFYSGEPVAYLTGMKEFYGLDFFVNKNVLIPRPETEHLVDSVLSWSQKNGEVPSILDVGTGSGCIAVSLAKKLLSVKITASDISPDALEVARINAKRHGVSDRITFVLADLMAGVEGSFDIIVANLPYIGKKKYNFISRETYEHEPHVALFGGEDGLQLYEKFFQQIAGRNLRPRLFLGEFGFLQGDDMRHLLSRYFSDAETKIVKDYASIDRAFVVAF